MGPQNSRFIDQPDNGHGKPVGDGLATLNRTTEYAQRKGNFRANWEVPSSERDAAKIASNALEGRSLNHAACLLRANDPSLSRFAGLCWEIFSATCEIFHYRVDSARWIRIVVRSPRTNDSFRTVERRLPNLSFRRIDRLRGVCAVDACIARVRRMPYRPGNDDRVPASRKA